MFGNKNDYNKTVKIKAIKRVLYNWLFYYTNQTSVTHDCEKDREKLTNSNHDYHSLYSLIGEVVTVGDNKSENIPLF